MNISESKIQQVGEKHFQTLVEKTSEGLILLNNTLEIIYINPAVEAMSGFRFEEMKDFSNKDFIYPDELGMVAELLKKSYENAGVSIRAQMRARHKDGHYLWIEGIITNLLEDDEVEAFVLNFRDITDRKKAEEIIHELHIGLEEKILERTAQLQTLNKELEAFTYSVSHDLRAPLRAINGYAKLLQEDYSGVLDADGNEFIEIIRENATNMGQLIDDLLEYTKVARKEMEYKHIDMSALAASIKAELDVTMPNKAEIQIKRLHNIDADTRLMHQLLFNLMSNAVKYSSKKEKPVIIISSEVCRDEIIYSVSDNGAGFDMRHVSKLFGIFNRLHTTDEFEGVGVGLAIVHRIVEKFGGRIWAEGKVNEGATFYFSFGKKKGNDAGR